jgi:hypothetical protein
MNYNIKIYFNMNYNKLTSRRILEDGILQQKFSLSMSSKNTVKVKLSLCLIKHHAMRT